MCACGHGYCDLQHITWECNQHIILRNELKATLSEKHNINVFDTPSVLATMNVQIIQTFCDFFIKAGITI